MTLIKPRSLLLLCAFFGRIQARGSENDVGEHSLIHAPALVEVDGAGGLAVEAFVEHPVEMRDLGALGEGQPHYVLERIGDAKDSVVRPDRHPRRFGRFLPFHFFDCAVVGFQDHGPHVRQSFAASVPRLLDDGVDSCFFEVGIFHS